MELLGGAKYFVPIRKVVVDGIRHYLFVLKFCFLVKLMSKYGTQKNEIKKKPSEKQYKHTPIYRSRDNSFSLLCCRLLSFLRA